MYLLLWTHAVPIKYILRIMWLNKMCIYYHSDMQLFCFVSGMPRFTKWSFLRYKRCNFLNNFRIICTPWKWHVHGAVVERYNSKKKNDIKTKKTRKKNLWKIRIARGLLHNKLLPYLLNVTCIHVQPIPRYFESVAD